MHQTKLPYSELLRIKPEIEATTSAGSGIANREFIWLYEPGQPLVEIPSDFDSYGIDFSIPSGTGAVATLHNHCSGNAVPSDEDIYTFLKFMEVNPSLTLALIASTTNGKVGGYFVMEYRGRKDELPEMRGIAWKKFVDLKSKEIRKNPKAHGYLYGVSGRASDFAYLKRMSLEVLPLIHVESEFVPMPGYIVDGWAFAKEKTGLISYISSLTRLC